MWQEIIRKWQFGTRYTLSDLYLKLETKIIRGLFSFIVKSRTFMSTVTIIQQSLYGMPLQLLHCELRLIAAAIIELWVINTTLIL